MAFNYYAIISNETLCNLGDTLFKMIYQFNSRSVFVFQLNSAWIAYVFWDKKKKSICIIIIVIGNVSPFMPFGTPSCALSCVLGPRLHSAFHEGALLHWQSVQLITSIWACIMHTRYNIQTDWWPWGPQPGGRLLKPRSSHSVVRQPQLLSIAQFCDSDQSKLFKRN